MSRIGKKPIPIPPKVEIKMEDQQITIKGPKGELKRELCKQISIEQQGQNLLVKRCDDSREARQLHGLSRTLVWNMIEGVSKGFQRRLEIIGVGYRAAIEDKILILTVGYSHKVPINPPPGIDIKVENNTNIILSGFDKEALGNLAARIRAVRKPEPYKGKGIRYGGEIVKTKQGKTGKKK